MAITFSDFFSRFGKAVDAVWEDGDFNADGRVTFEDFIILSANYGNRRPEM